MKKLSITLIITLFLIGCGPSEQIPQQPNPAPQTTPSPTQTNPTPIEEDKIPSIGGISLGDSVEKVNSILGTEYTSKAIEDGGYFGEPYYERTYNKGLKLIIGKNSGKVLQIMSTDPNAATELGIKISDPSETILQRYRTKYKEPVSPHGAGTLQGWFEVENGQLMIFDFDAEDESMVNEKIDPNSKVERLILAYSKFLD